MLDPSSDCLVTGLSVNVGLNPPSGTGASSPTFKHVLQPKFLFIMSLTHGNEHSVIWHNCSDNGSSPIVCYCNCTISQYDITEKYINIRRVYTTRWRAKDELRKNCWLWKHIRKETIYKVLTYIIPESMLKVKDEQPLILVGS